MTVARKGSMSVYFLLRFLMTTFYYHSYEYFEHLRNRNRPFVLIRKNVRQICFDARLLTKKSWEIRILIEICIKVYSSFPLQTCRFWCIFVNFAITSNITWFLCLIGNLFATIVYVLQTIKIAVLLYLDDTIKCWFKEVTGTNK